jgi:hypothetical protein
VLTKDERDRVGVKDEEEVLGDDSEDGDLVGMDF